MTAPLEISFACGPYDRMRAIFDGSVAVAGARVRPVAIATPSEIFRRMLERDEFDVAEMSFTHCFVLQANDSARFVTIPIFPSRMFRHGFVFVNREAGIGEPRDLAGKRIGVQGYQMTAAVWQRAFLRSDFGVDLGGVRWTEGGVNHTGVTGGATTRLRPANALDIGAAPEGTTLSELLLRGEIDALIGADVPTSYVPDGPVARLFPDYPEIERAAYTATGVYPIMHALAIRRDLYEREPWIAPALYDACERAKRIALEGMHATSALRYMLPWLIAEVEANDALFGGDPWPYGIEANRPTLDAFNRALTDDGFLGEPLPLERVFVPVSSTSPHVPAAS